MNVIDKLNAVTGKVQYVPPMETEQEFMKRYNIERAKVMAYQIKYMIDHGSI